MAEILNDKYEVLKLIGRGGVGKIYLARDLHLQRLVVIKESRKEYLLTEMELLKELRHPGLPLIYDCFRTPYRKAPHRREPSKKAPFEKVPFL